MSSNTENKAPGTLWVVGTPLGNPGDLSPRARQCLEDADVVLAEDTKREALRIGRECNQISVLGWKGMKLIYCEG